MHHTLARPYHGRKMWAILIGIVVATLMFGGCSANTAKVYRVGILSGLDFFSPTADSFKAKMAELGYIEGQNITYDLQRTNLDPAAEEQILGKFVADKVDLIFVFPTEVSLAAKKAIQGTDIPVVFANAFIEQGGLVKSLREPGGNTTGVRFAGPDIAIKRLEILRELAPKAKRIWVPYQKGYPNVPFQLEALRPAATTAGVTKHAPATRSPASPAREAPISSASSVDVGPGSACAAASSSRNSARVSQPRFVTHSRSMSTRCAAGPPKPVTPSRPKTDATSRSRAARLTNARPPLRAGARTRRATWRA